MTDDLYTFVIPPPPKPRPDADPNADLHQASFCIECDAPERGCEHTGRRYLADAVYTLVAGDDPASFVWQASPADRARMESGSGAAHVNPSETAIPHGDLLAEIEQRVYCDDRMMALLDSAYSADAVRTSRAVSSAAETYDRGKVQSFGGLIVKRLREIVQREER